MELMFQPPNIPEKDLQASLQFVSGQLMLALDGQHPNRYMCELGGMLVDPAPPPSGEALAARPTGSPVREPRGVPQLGGRTWRIFR